ELQLGVFVVFHDLRIASRRVLVKLDAQDGEILMKQFIHPLLATNRKVFLVWLVFLIGFVTPVLPVASSISGHAADPCSIPNFSTANISSLAGAKELLVADFNKTASRTWPSPMIRLWVGSRFCS